jgi:putative transposase
MRVEPHTIGDIVHVYNRGNRKMPIVHNEKDKQRFLKSLRFFNEETSITTLLAKINVCSEAAFKQRSVFNIELPINWSNPKPLVKILCFFLAPNHFHLLLKEIMEGGITKFMEKLGTGFTNYSNLKYKEVGRIFQGPYKGRTIKEMNYLQYLNVYIQVLNPLELYPGGLEKASQEFDQAFEFAMNYRFGSLPDFFGKRNFGIIDTDKDVFEATFLNIKKYKEFAHDCLLTKNLKETLGKLAID